jgi:hypothetical protein
MAMTMKNPYFIVFEVFMVDYKESVMCWIRSFYSCDHETPCLCWIQGSFGYDHEYLYYIVFESFMAVTMKNPYFVGF